ncbi:MAG: ERAP1-like C-terminal domain-containing protein [Gemmatimonadota bacterium]|nr:MAG: ERAP1-like C-terminal domain-containing protein [Gemmatimonadota bacterium]
MTRFNRWSMAIALAGLPAAACDRGPDVSPGVSWDLATHRVETVLAAHYDLTLRVPAALDEPVEGVLTLTVRLREASDPLVLDFTAPEGSVRGVTAAGDPVPHEHRNGHLVIPAAALRPGENALTVEFTAGAGALNRNEEFLYTLFVPDRASSAFPCFDQPNLKAAYRLTLTVPAAWSAVANTPMVSSDSAGGTRTVTFARTKPLSTYLFAFAAGVFEVETATRGGRALRLFHRETDRERVARNLEAIFDLHGAALEWLERYTGIPYPFEKFDFVAVPAFQYGGMEHPGAILYRASRLFLDEAATQNDRLGRASLIAHETAHMWFGDLVTMAWFDDVWMKEVFANFMAAKVVNPSFPAIRHDLRFFLAHHPAAYAVDRTAGANPIRQELENLNEAGTLYGAIIYQKAPIVMQQLERLIGAEAMREGLQEYLASHAFANATWTDLIAILDRRADADLAAWSRTWVEEAGRPTVSVSVERDDDGPATLIVRQADPRRRNLLWPQSLTVLLGYGDTTQAVPVTLEGSEARLDLGDIGIPDYVLAGGDGVSYGLFQLDGPSREYLLGHLAAIQDPLRRAVAWAALWEALLSAEVSAEAFLDLALRALPQEPDEQNVERILAYVAPAFWRFLPNERRGAVGGRLEALLWGELQRAESTSLKAAYLDALVATAVSADAVARLDALWRGELEIPGLPMSEQRYTALAEALAVRGVPNAAEILAAQLARIENPDRRARFAFITPAFSHDPEVRDSLFAELRNARNREHEPWVLSAIAALHHPLRAESAEHYLRPSLDLLQEIQRTGDIFFPLRWLHATLDGHSSPNAAATVRDFLRGHPDYPSRLRGKVLQAADGLFRAAALRE